MDAGCRGTATKDRIRRARAPDATSGYGAPQGSGAPRWIPICALLLIAAYLLAGCAGSTLRAFGGTWQPANRYPQQAVRLPFRADYLYFAAPIDGTLRTLLARWARDTGRRLDYRVPFDLTLHAPVAAIRTADVQAAVSRLNDLYAAQGVSVRADAATIQLEAAPPRTATRGDATATPGAATPGLVP